MSVSVDELTEARDIVYRLLDELQIEAFLFEVEPYNEEWGIIIECALTEGWERIRLTTTRRDLLASKDDAVLHQKLLGGWREQLAACKRKGI